jgi:hypothetical protein
VEAHRRQGQRGTKGGDAGEWSARKAQLATAEYQKAAAATQAAEGGHPLGAVGRGAPGRRGKAAARRKAAPAKARPPRRSQDLLGRRPSRPRSGTRGRRVPRAGEHEPDSLKRWLATKRSQEVGLRKGKATESIGHQSGQLIVELLGKKPTDEHSAEERAHMRKVISYIKRHSAQRPEGDVESTVWRASLMNWGHDPLKD